jgi:hypothetical protein
MAQPFLREAGGKLLCVYAPDANYITHASDSYTKLWAGNSNMTINIVTIDGANIQLDESSIILFAGPYPYDVGSHTYIYTSEPKQLVTTEDVEHFAQRVPNAGDFAILTRPNLSPVRIKGSAAVNLRLALGTEAPAKCVVFVRQLHQAVMEDLATARRIINAHGGCLGAAEV